MKMTGDVIVLFNDNELNVFTAKGVNKYKGKVEEGINELVTTEEKYKYTIISGEKLLDIKLN